MFSSAKEWPNDNQNHSLRRAQVAEGPKQFIFLLLKNPIDFVERHSQSSTSLLEGSGLN